MPHSPRPGGDNYTTVAQKEARALSKHAVEQGLLKRQVCEVCGKPAEAHHDDYDRPLLVRWLCKRHHIDWHKAFEPLNK
jgi:hypothetical protein